MSSVKNWLKDIFVSLPDVAEKILEELLKNEDAAQKREKERKKHRNQQKQNTTLVHVLPLRLVCKDLKNIVDNYEKVWARFDKDQPLLYPTLIGHVGILQRLLAKGVDINKRGAKKCWRSKNYWSRNDDAFLPPCPLDLAAKYGVLDSARLLIERGALIHPKDAHGDWDFDARNGRLQVVELLVSETRSRTRSQAATNVQDLMDSTAVCDYTPLHYAAENGHQEVVEWLVRQGADASPWEADGMTPVAIALLNGHVGISDFVTAKGGFFNDPYGEIAKRYCKDCQAITGRKILEDPVGWLRHIKSHARSSPSARSPSPYDEHDDRQEEEHFVASLPTLMEGHFVYYPWVSNRTHTELYNRLARAVKF